MVPRALLGKAIIFTRIREAELSLIKGDAADRPLWSIQLLYPLS
jgi:hypothetical protein